eukprot:m.18001 g.18001  ORF g.18001 m.18001 type:complete len:59 (+) comp5605_c0_seq1:124-300(+)
MIHLATQVMTIIRKGERLKMSRSAPAWCAGLMTRCWDQNPGSRPSFSDIVAVFDKQLR